MAINREIMFILRMRNEARAEIQSFVSDIRSLQTQMGTFPSMPVYRNGNVPIPTAPVANTPNIATGVNSAANDPAVMAERAAQILLRSTTDAAAIRQRSESLAAESVARVNRTRQKTDDDSASLLLRTTTKASNDTMAATQRTDDRRTANILKNIQNEDTANDKRLSNNTASLLRDAAKRTETDTKQTNDLANAEHKRLEMSATQQNTRELSALTTAQRIDDLKRVTDTRTTEIAQRTADTTAAIAKRASASADAITLNGVTRDAAITNRAALAAADATSRATTKNNNETLIATTKVAGLSATNTSENILKQLKAANERVIRATQAQADMDARQIKQQQILQQNAAAFQTAQLRRDAESAAKIAYNNSNGWSGGGNGGGGGGRGGSGGGGNGSFGGMFSGSNSPAEYAKAMGILALEAGLAYFAIEKLKEGFVAFLQAGDRITGSTRQLSTALRISGDQATEVYNKLQAGAEKTGTDITETTRSFVRFSMATRELGKTSDDVIDFTNTLHQLALISGTSTHYANLAFVQLAEGMSIGRLQGQHFKALMSDFPAVMNALGEATHKTTGQLQEMAHAGQLTPEFLFNGIRKAGESIHETVANMPVTLEQAIGKSISAISNMMGQIDQKIGSSKFLSKYLSSFSDSVERASQNINPDINRQIENLSDKLKTVETSATRLQDSQARAKYQTPAPNSPGSRSSLEALAARDAASDGLPNYLSAPKNREDQIKAIRQQMTALESLSEATRMNTQAEADARKVAGDHQKIVDGVTTAMGDETKATLKTKEEIGFLEQALREAGDTGEAFGFKTSVIGDRLDFLRGKIEPLTAVLASMSTELKQADADAGGKIAGAISKRYEEMKKNLHGGEVDANALGMITEQETAIAASRATPQIRKDQEQLELAKARLRDKDGRTGGKYERETQVEINYQNNVRDVGEGPAKIKRTLELQTAEVNTAAANIGGGERAANALSDQKLKTREAQQALEAFIATGNKGATMARLMGEAQLEASKETRHSTGETEAQTSALLALKVAAEIAIGGLTMKKAIASDRETIKELDEELSLSKLSNAERTRAIALLHLQREASKQAPLNPELQKERVDVGMVALDKKQEAEAKARIQDKLDGYKEEISLMGLTKNALEEEKAVRFTIDELRKRGIKSDSEDATKQKEYTEEVKATRDAILQLQAARREKQGDGLAGFSAGLKDLQTDSENVFDKMKGLATNTFSSMSDALSTFAMTGKLNFASFATSIIKDMIRIAAQQALVGVLKAGISLLAGPSTAGTSVGSAEPLTGMVSGGGSAFANGGIMDGDGARNLRKYANGGIANSPQTAIFGEGDRPEAYVPLPDGRHIPVKMTGAHGGGNVTHIHNVTNHTTMNVTNGGSGSESNDHNKTMQDAMLQLNSALDARMTDYAYKAKRPGGSNNVNRNY